jgi:Lrp/AsnC family transcriptional regulator, leucine-responsive regulatory protein
MESTTYVSVLRCIFAINAAIISATDKIDIRILSLLQRDGRTSFRDLGEAVHLSANAAAERVRRMLNEGTIRSITANVNPAKLGRPLEAQIDVKLRQGVSAAAFEKALQGAPQIQSATLLTGSFDYAVHVACRDQGDLVEVTEYMRNKCGAGETYSRVILREISVA